MRRTKRVCVCTRETRRESERARISGRHSGNVRLFTFPKVIDVLLLIEDQEEDGHKIQDGPPPISHTEVEEKVVTTNQEVLKVLSGRYSIHLSY